MRWYLLRDRRHEGPYTKEQIAASVKAGNIDPRDYLLPEIATQDQSSFAYISAGDVLGPEFIYDLNKAQNKPLSASASSTSTDPSVPASSNASKDQLISEFEDGLESTQLVNIKKEKAQSESRVGYNPASLESFASNPTSSFKFPWAIVAVAVVVLGATAFIAPSLMDSLPKADLAAPAAPAPTQQAASFRSLKQNRVPTGRVQLPTSVRDEEPAPSVINIRSEEQAAEPARKRRKRRAVENESTEAVEDSEAASDAESFDEEEYVEEDESSEEDVDEADI